jgi:hypothetical protein
MAERRHRVVGQSLLVPFCWAGTAAFEKGTRRKGETISRRYRSNGYVLRQQSPTGFDEAWINIGRGAASAIRFTSPRKQQAEALASART